MLLVGFPAHPFWLSGQIRIVGFELAKQMAVTAVASPVNASGVALRLIGYAVGLAGKKAPGTAWQIDFAHDKAGVRANGKPAPATKPTRAGGEGYRVIYGLIRDTIGKLQRGGVLKGLVNHCPSLAAMIDAIVI